MTISVTPLMEHLAAEIGGADIAAGVDDADFRDIEAAFHAHSVLIFRDQRIDDEQQIAFSRRFGPLETMLPHRSNYGKPGHIARLTNVAPDGKIIAADDKRMKYNSANNFWHSDSSFKKVPARASLLSGREVPPEGGETEFASMRAAYAALSEERKAQLKGLVAEHDFTYSRSKVAPDLVIDEQKKLVPPVPQAMVLTDPVTGRKSLYVGAHAARVLDMPAAEGRALIDELIEFITRPPFVYRHKWKQYDAVMWDNRAVIHRGRPWDHANYRRVMHRTTIAGDGPTV